MCTSAPPRLRLRRNIVDQAGLALGLLALVELLLEVLGLLGSTRVALGLLDDLGLQLLCGRVVVAHVGFVVIAQIATTYSTMSREASEPAIASCLAPATE